MPWLQLSILVFSLSLPPSFLSFFFFFLTGPVPCDLAAPRLSWRLEIRWGGIQLGGGFRLLKRICAFLSGDAKEKKKKKRGLKRYIKAELQSYWEMRVGRGEEGGEGLVCRHERERVCMLRFLFVMPSARSGGRQFFVFHSNVAVNPLIVLNYLMGSNWGPLIVREERPSWSSCGKKDPRMNKHPPPHPHSVCLRREEDEKESVELWEKCVAKAWGGAGKKKKKELVLQMMGRLSVKRMCAHFQFCPSPSSFLLLPLLPLLIMMRGWHGSGPCSVNQLM